MSNGEYPSADEQSGAAVLPSLIPEEPGGGAGFPGVAGEERDPLAGRPGEGERGRLVPHKCLKCEGRLSSTPAAMDCSACGASWPVEDGVPLYGSAGYFGEVSQDETRQLVELARESHWLTAVRDRFKDKSPDMYRYVADLNRASWIPLLPIGPDSTVLDVGSGLGALTHALALNYERVVSIEPIAERVRFTKVRLDQEGLDNVDLIQTSLDALPFYEKTFDLIVLNGILEWVGSWHREQTPRDAQLDVLNMLRRMLKPGGVLLVGIENRIGFDAFLGRLNHTGLPFTSLMPRWLASLYLRARGPGFYRTALAPALGYRTYTYSPRGYAKLLREAGFGSMEMWWPPQGYNGPYELYRATERAEIEGYFLNDRKGKNRINGYALRRALKDSLLVKTGLIYATFPDLVMLARAEAGGSPGRADGGAPLLEALQRVLAARRETAGERGILHASALTSRKLRNKSIIKLVTPAGANRAIAKVANVKLPNADSIEQCHKLLERLHDRFESAGPLRGTVPSPIAVLRVGSLVASLEEAASGVPLIDHTQEPRYFADRQRVRRHLENAASWLMEAQPALQSLESEIDSPRVPSAWRQAPGGGGGEIGSPASDGTSWVQHGDLFPNNVFLDERSERLCVIDWDQCHAGYPPLFDWFCLVTGLYYTHRRVKRLPKGQTTESQSFRETYFEPSWFADAVLGLTLRICDRLGLERARIIDYFREYLAVLCHQFDHDRDSCSKERWGHLYRDFYESFVKNRERCILHPSRIR